MMEGNGTLTPRATPIREDCWSEEATSTLIDAWGERHLELNRGNLRQKHWQEVADAVNAEHGATKKARRTDIQCKNRIDTLKKKYKLEKAKILASGGTVTSQWPFYDRLHMLVGPNVPPKKLLSPQLPSSSSPSPPLALPLPLQYRKTLSPQAMAMAAAVPVAPRSAREKRPAAPPPLSVDDSFFRRNYSAVAAAAAADTDSESSRSSTGSRRKEREREREKESEREREGEVDGMRELAQAIVKFGEIYEKVEVVKQRQMVELEKQRMEFMKNLEFQRMQLFMDWQVQLEKIKRSKRSNTSGEETIIPLDLFNNGVMNYPYL